MYICAYVYERSFIRVISVLSLTMLVLQYMLHCRLFHVSRIYKDPCQEWYLHKKCSNRYLCTFAHPESPEVLYNSAWYDLYVIGLDQTFEYLLGAIRNLRFINTVQPGVYILLVTPSLFMANWLALAANEACNDHKKQVAVVSEGEYNIVGSQVVIGTPGGIVQLMSIKHIGPQMACLIVDDSSVVLARDWMALQTIIQLLQQNRARSATCMNKVVVSERLSQPEVGTYSNFLGTKLKVVDNCIDVGNSKPVGLLQPQPSQVPSAPKWKDVVATQDLGPNYSSQTESSIAAHGWSTVEAFNMGKAFSVLNSICEYLGVLGPSLRTIIIKALDFGSDTVSMKALFKDSDSMSLMMLVEEKLRALEREFYQDTPKREIFASAIGHIKLLLDKDQSSPLQQPSHQQTVQGGYDRGPQVIGNNNRSLSVDDSRSQGGDRGRNPNSIDYGHQHQGRADYEKDRNRARDKYGEQRSSIDYDSREGRGSSDYSRQSSDLYRREERGGSIDYNRGPDRGDPFRRDERGGSIDYNRGPVREDSFRRDERGGPIDYDRGPVRDDPFRRDEHGGPIDYDRGPVRDDPFRRDERGGPIDYDRGPVRDDPFRREEHGGSMDYSRGPDRGPSEYGRDYRDFANHDRLLPPSDYGREPPGASGYGRNSQGPSNYGRQQNSSGYWR
ncbi:unnamed protein product [Meganyctiphanes norvegica]|uniref:C3H1-type domain-containing protein n=1 Tax=Meganyctiphanes norvegica TaxID=48144 RepID=A0AAV2Q613_MEGNR